MTTRRDFTRELTQWMGVAAAVASAAGCTTTSSGGGSLTVRPDERSLDDMYRAALAEGGQLVVYGGGDLPNGGAGLETAFVRRFPNMKIRVLVDRSKFQGVRIDNQLARNKLQPDVVHILAHHYYDRWKAESRLLAYKPPGWDQVPVEYHDPDGFWTATAIFAFAPYINTDLIPLDQAPRDFIDFVDPKFKGKLALTYPNEDDSILWQFDQAIAKHGWDWLDRLASQDVLWVQGSGINRQMIERGERAASFNTSGPLIPPANAKTRFLLPRTDRFLSWAHPTAIFRQARHPEAAKLYVAWLLSSERQGGGSTWSVRRDMPVPAGYGPLSSHTTSPVAFREALRDRARMERLRDQITQVIGPPLSPNPTRIAGVFPE